MVNIVKMTVKRYFRGLMNVSHTTNFDLLATRENPALNSRVFYVAIAKWVVSSANVIFTLPNKSDLVVRKRPSDKKKK